MLRPSRSAKLYAYNFAPPQAAADRLSIGRQVVRRTDLGALAVWDWRLRGGSEAGLHSEAEAELDTGLLHHLDPRPCQAGHFQEGDRLRRSIPSLLWIKVTGLPS